MSWLYLRYRARMLWRAVEPTSRADWGARIAVAVIVLINLPILGLMYWGVYMVFGQIEQTVGLSVLRSLLHLPATAFGVGLLLLASGRAYPILAESADHDLLRVMPWSPAILARVRLTHLSVLLSPIILLFLPIIVFYAIHAGASPVGFATALATALLLGVGLIGWGILITLALSLPLPDRAMQWGSRLTTLVVVLPIAFGGMFLAPMIQQLREAGDGLAELGEGLAFGPAAWFVSAIHGASLGEWGEWAGGVAPLLVLTLAGWTAGILLAKSLARGEPPAQWQAPGLAHGIGWWAPRWLHADSRALWRRDLKAVVDEAPRMLLLPVAFVAFFAVLSRFGLSAIPLYYMLGLMLMSLASGLTLSAIGQEQRAFWVLKTLPVPMWKVLWIKLVVRSIVSLGTIAVAFALVIAIAPGMPLPVDASLVPLLIPVVFVSLLLASVWGMGIGARFPRFIPPRKGQYVSTGASLAGSFGSMGIVATMVLSLLPLQVDALRPILWFLPLVVTVFWAGLCVLLVVWAAWHLERLEL